MATKLICDVCDEEVKDMIKIEVLNGEHPHCGSTMHKEIDICWECLKKLSKKSPYMLSCQIEWENIK